MAHRGVAPAQGTVGQVAAQLRLRPVERGGGFRAAPGPLPPEIFQLDDVAIPDVRVPRRERLEIQVRVAEVQFGFRVDQEMVRQAEMHRQERLHELFAVDIVADSRLARQRVAQIVQHRTPFAPARHGAQQAMQAIRVGREKPGVVEGVAQEPVHQLADGLVGNPQHGALRRGAANAEKPEKIQQGEEVLATGQAFHRKTRPDGGFRPPFGDDAAQQVEIAVQFRFGGRRPPVHYQKMPQLAVVDAHIVVDQVIRTRFVGDRRLEIIQDHVSVIDARPGSPGEPVAVVPLAHDLQGFVRVAVEHAVPAIGFQQPPHFRFGEPEHFVEAGIQADVPADIEAAGDVVHRDGRDPRDEHPFDAAAACRAGLQRGEEVAVETAAVGQGLVFLLAVVGEHGVGEIVVFVDENIQRDAAVAGILEQFVELGIDGRAREDALPHGLREQVRVPAQGVEEHRVAIDLEALLQGGEGIAERREVEPQDDVAVAVRRGAAPDVGSAEHRLEIAGAAAVVIVLQHRQPAGLAETARADEKGVALLFQRAQEARLVHIEEAFAPDGAEVGHAVGDAGPSIGHGGFLGGRRRRSVHHTRSAGAAETNAPCSGPRSAARLAGLSQRLAVIRPAGGFGVHDFENAGKFRTVEPAPARRGAGEELKNKTCSFQPPRARPARRSQRKAGHGKRRRANPRAIHVRGAGPSARSRLRCRRRRRPPPARSGAGCSRRRNIRSD